MHIPPIRQNAENRTVHEILRLQINKEIDTWTSEHPKIHAVPQPKNVDNGESKNYMFDKDPVHFTNEANGAVVLQNAKVSCKLLLS